MASLSNVGKDIAELHQATEALVRAVSSQLKTHALKYTEESEHGWQSLSSDVKSIKHSVEQCQSTLLLISGRLQCLQSSIELQEKIRRLQWAIDHVSLNEFNCRNSEGELLVSSTILRQVLMGFMCNNGSYIDMYFIGEQHHHRRITPEGQERFKEKLLYQIQSLIGFIPRIHTEGTKCSIWYE